MSSSTTLFYVSLECKCKSNYMNLVPSYFTGAAFGRFFGECMAFYFPEGLRGVVITPGAYSIIGAATLSGAMSHTVSPAVIAFEMTGYLGHILPCVVCHLLLMENLNLVSSQEIFIIIKVLAQKLLTSCLFLSERHQTSLKSYLSHRW